MKSEVLYAISPTDGRYRHKVQELSSYFSEYALIRYRLKIEIEYFIALCELPLPQLADFDKKYFRRLRLILSDFCLKDAEKIKVAEKTTNHDIKAAEYFLKEKFEELNIGKYKEFIRFGLSPQDINNTAVPMLLQDAVDEVILPNLQDFLSDLFELAEQWSDVPMLARTHGQPACPTRTGKELEVFIERLRKQISYIQLIPFSAKFGGTAGNFNALHVAYPGIDWVQFANSFVNHVLNLDRSQTTTQIEHYDNLAALFDNFKRINTILLDLSRDMWMYISQNYFKPKIKKEEIDTSAVSHKANPIDFENAEGNLGIANALFEHFSAKLPVSRLQRDLSDSTVLRNIGVPLAHMLIAVKSLRKGFCKLELNKTEIKADLQNNYSVITEAVQSILHRENYPQPYEALKTLTETNQIINIEIMHNFIDNLDISGAIKTELKQITPENYTGI